MFVQTIANPVALMVGYNPNTCRVGTNHQQSSHFPSSPVLVFLHFIESRKPVTCFHPVSRGERTLTYHWFVSAILFNWFGRCSKVGSCIIENTKSRTFRLDHYNFQVQIRIQLIIINIIKFRFDKLLVTTSTLSL